jgi:dipeptidyl-peptidase-4
MRMVKPLRGRAGRTICRLFPLLGCVLLWGASVGAAGIDPTLTLDRIFDSEEFSSERFGPVRWLEHGNGYTTLVAGEEVSGGEDIVVHDPATRNAEVLVSARLLIPEGGTTALAIDDYTWSEDGARLLIYTNSKKVWRDNTRGDYWVLDLATETLQQLGGDVPPLPIATSHRRSG